MYCVGDRCQSVRVYAGAHQGDEERSRRQGILSRIQIRSSWSVQFNA